MGVYEIISILLVVASKKFELVVDDIWITENNNRDKIFIFHFILAQLLGKNILTYLLNVNEIAASNDLIFYRNKGKGKTNTTHPSLLDYQNNIEI